MDALAVAVAEGPPPGGDPPVCHAKPTPDRGMYAPKGREGRDTGTQYPGHSFVSRIV